VLVLERNAMFAQRLPCRLSRRILVGRIQRLRDEHAPDEAAPILRTSDRTVCCPGGTKMNVARYEVPGSLEKQVPSRRERYDWVQQDILRRGAVSASCSAAQTVPTGRIASLNTSQALRTWLRSFSPSGTANSSVTCPHSRRRSRQLTQLSRTSRSTSTG
jgi:hypothetical protein